MTGGPVAAERVNRPPAPREGFAPGRSAPGALPEEVRIQMERHFGTEFGDVRVHPDRALPRGAHAMTTGRDVHFAPGAYQPRTAAGRGLIAHELTHVVQQRAGRFNPAGAAPIANRVGLELEADSAARAVEGGGGRVSVNSAAAPGVPQYRGAREDPLGYPGVAALDALAGRALSSRPDDPELRQLGALRDQVKSMQALWLPPAEIALLEAHIAVLRGLLPSWVPVPDLSAARPQVQYAAVIALPLAVVVLFFLLCLIVLIWLMIPLEQKQRMFEDLIRFLKGPWPAPAPPKQAPDAKTKPDPQTKPDPDPKPKPDDKPPPLGPDLWPDPEEERGCIRMVVGQRGGNDCHDQFATSYSGTSREYRVCTPPPRPLCVDFDAISRDGGTLYEIKTGYGFLLGTDPGNEFRRAATRARFIDQSEDQLEVAARCGFSLIWVFNREDVANRVNGFLRVPVTSRDFDCEVDA